MALVDPTIDTSSRQRALASQQAMLMAALERESRDLDRQEERRYREAATRQAHANALAVMERQAEINRQAQIEAENRAFANRAMALGYNVEPDGITPEVMSAIYTGERSRALADQAMKNQMALDLAEEQKRAQLAVQQAQEAEQARAFLESYPERVAVDPFSPSILPFYEIDPETGAYKKGGPSAAVRATVNAMSPLQAIGTAARVAQEAKDDAALELKRKEFDLTRKFNDQAAERAQIAEANKASMQSLIDLNMPIPEGGMPVDLQGALELQRQMGSLSKFQNPELRATAAVYYTAQESFGRAIAKAEADGDSDTANKLKDEEAKLTKAIAGSGTSGYVTVLRKERELERLEASRMLAQTRGDQRLLAMLNARIAAAVEDLENDPYYFGPEGVAPKPDTGTGTGTGVVLTPDDGYVNLNKQNRAVLEAVLERPDLVSDAENLPRDLAIIQSLPPIEGGGIPQIRKGLSRRLGADLNLVSKEDLDVVAEAQKAVGGKFNSVEVLLPKLKKNQEVWKTTSVNFWTGEANSVEALELRLKALQAPKPRKIGVQYISDTKGNGRWDIVPVLGGGFSESEILKGKLAKEIASVKSQLEKARYNYEYWTRLVDGVSSIAKDRTPAPAPAPTPAPAAPAAAAALAPTPAPSPPHGRDHRTAWGTSDPREKDTGISWIRRVFGDD